MSLSFGRTRAALPLALAAILALSACTAIDGGSSDAPDATAGGGGGGGGQLVIATGGTGGVYYPLGGGLANVISDNIEGASADHLGRRTRRSTTCCSSRTAARTWRSCSATRPPMR